MAALRSKSITFVWPVVFVVLLGVVSVSYLAFRPNRDNQQVTVNKDVKVAQPKSQSAVEEKEVATGTVITVGASQYGAMLFDSKGQAIYIWQLENSATAKCYGNCAKEWPPVLTNGAPVTSEGVSGAMLGTTKRTDGTTQVTYNNHPLYYYAHEKAGEVECHNISTHGGLWWVIQPNGIRAQ